MEATAAMTEEATAPGASIARMIAESMRAEARGIISPRMVLRHHHLVREAEAGAEDLAPAQNPLGNGGTHEMRGNA
jgi:hypothetical protein